MKNKEKNGYQIGDRIILTPPISESEDCGYIRSFSDDGVEIEMKYFMGRTRIICRKFGEFIKHSDEGWLV